MDPLTIMAVARGLSAFVPGLVRWVAGDKAGDVAEQAVDVAKKVTGITDPEDALSAIQRDPQLQIQLQQTMTPVLIAQYEAYSRDLETVNATMRGEYQSNDTFVRRWRPTLGYVVSFSWGVQMLSLSILILKDPAAAVNVITAMTALSFMWGIAMSILGISVSKRSQDKRVAAGQKPEPGLLNIIAQRFARQPTQSK